MIINIVITLIINPPGASIHWWKILRMSTANSPFPYRLWLGNWEWAGAIQSFKHTGNYREMSGDY